MKRAIGQKPDFVAKARGAWGAALPAWVIALAEHCNRTSATSAAKKLGYSTAVVSHVIANTYAGDLGRVAEKAKGAFMGATVRCPVLGDIRRDRCLDEQQKKFTGSSSIRSKLYRACRSGCPHSLLKQE